MPRRSLRDQILGPVEKAAERVISKVARTEKKINRRAGSMVRKFTLGPRRAKTYKRNRGGYPPVDYSKWTVSTRPYNKGTRVYGLKKKNKLSSRSVQAPVSIKKSEFVCNINGSTGFTSQNYGISLLNPNLFYWGSQVLPNYEMYKVKSMSFHFKSTSGNNSTTSALGTVIMGIAYDVNDPQLIDQYTMLNYQGFLQCAIDKNQSIHLVTKNNPLKVRYVSHNSTAAEFNDYGVFYIATYGNPSTGLAIGQLWVDYDLELYIPRPANVLAVQSGGSIESAAAGTYTWQTNGVPLGPNLLTVNNSGNPSIFSINGPGYYILNVLTFSGTAVLTAIGSTIPTLANCIFYAPSIAQYVSNSLFNSNTFFQTLGANPFQVGRFFIDASGWVSGSTTITFNNTITTSASGTWTNEWNCVRTPNLKASPTASLPEISTVQDDMEELKRQFAELKANSCILEPYDDNTNNSNVHRPGYFNRQDTPQLKVNTSRSSSNK